MNLLSGTGYQLAGRNSRITVQGDTGLTQTTWSVEWSVGNHDTTNFQSEQANGYMSAEGIYTISEFPWSFSGDWDAGANPVDIGQAPGIYPRDDLQSLTFYTTTTSSAPAWVYTYARVRSAKNGAVVTDAVSFEASGTNQGLVTVPTGSL